MPPVSPCGMRSVRRTVAPSDSVAAAPSDRADPPDHRGRGSSGSVASSPKNVWPGATVSRFVPRRSSSREQRRPARRRRSPSTATIAAMPMRDARARSAPSGAGARRGRGPRSRADGSEATGPQPRADRRVTVDDEPSRSGVGVRRPSSRPASRRIVRSIAPSREVDAARQRRRELAVVGDRRRSSCPRPWSSRSSSRIDAAGRGVEVAGRLVGQDERRSCRRGPGRWRRAAARRRTAAPAGGVPDAPARPARAPPRAASRRARPADAAVEQPVGDVVERGLARRAGGTAGTRTRSATRGAPDSEPVATGRPTSLAGDPRPSPVVGAVERAEEVEQRRLARARRADDREQLAGARSAGRRRERAATGGVRGIRASMTPASSTTGVALTTAPTTAVALGQPVAADLDPAVLEQPESRRATSVRGAGRVDDLDRVAAFEQRDERADRDREHVLARLA